MAFVHHTMLTAENLRGLPSKQLHTNVEPHYSPRSRAAPLCGVGGLVGVYSRPVIGRHFFAHYPDFPTVGLVVACVGCTLWGNSRYQILYIT